MELEILHRCIPNPDVLPDITYLNDEVNPRENTACLQAAIFLLGT